MVYGDLWCAKGYLKQRDTGGVRDTYKETRGIQEMDTMDTGVEVHQVGHIEKATNTCIQLTDEGKK